MAIVRKATDKEIEKILTYSLDVFKESTLGLFQPSVEKVQQMVAPVFLNGGYYLIYEKNNRIQGWVGVGTLYDNLSEEMTGVIPELYVLPSYRNQGIAERLCKKAIQNLQLDGYKKVQLNVFSKNHARKLYDKLGFREVITVMEKDLDQ